VLVLHTVVEPEMVIPLMGTHKFVPASSFSINLAFWGVNWVWLWFDAWVKYVTNDVLPAPIKF
jgi:hypothetical protein